MADVDPRASDFAADAIIRLEQLTSNFSSGHLTLKGLKLKRHNIVQEYLNQNSFDVNYLKFFETDWYEKLNHTEDFANVTSSLVTGLVKLPYVSAAAVTSRRLLWRSTRQLDWLKGTSSPATFDLKTEHKWGFTDFGGLGTYRGSLPWEKYSLTDESEGFDLRYFADHLHDSSPSEDHFYQRTNDGSRTSALGLAAVDIPPSNLPSVGRRLLDHFADSLLFVNRLYNEQLGLRLRKVPAHTPHFINVTVMEELQRRYGHGGAAAQVWSWRSCSAGTDMEELQRRFGYVGAVW